jgi:hypothetical protein
VAGLRGLDTTGFQRRGFRLVSNDGFDGHPGNRVEARSASFAHLLVKFDKEG